MQRVKYGNTWFGIDYTINLYRGCPHGCIYCDSRSSVYNNDNFDKVRVKENALSLLEKELKSKRNKGVISLGAMSDPYNPLEKQLNLTRDALKLIDHYGFGLSLETKSDLVTRDIDLFKTISDKGGAIIKISITDSNQERASIIEPYASSVEERFKAVKTLVDNDIYAGILMMPILPGINDCVENISEIVRQALNAKAKFIYPSFGVTLREGQKEYLLEQIKKTYPHLYEQYANTNQYYYPSKEAKYLRSIFEGLCKKHGILYRMEDIVKDFNDKKPHQLRLVL